MEPRQPARPRPVAMRLAATEYDRCVEVFRILSPAQWATPTDCPAWDVRQMAAHMLGMAEMAASIRENCPPHHQFLAGQEATRSRRATVASRVESGINCRAVPRYHRLP